MELLKINNGLLKSLNFRLDFEPEKFLSLSPEVSYHRKLTTEVIKERDTRLKKHQKEVEQKERELLKKLKDKYERG